MFITLSITQQLKRIRPYKPDRPLQDPALFADMSVSGTVVTSVIAGNLAAFAPVASRALQHLATGGLIGGGLLSRGAGGTRCFSSSGSAVPWHNCKAAPAALHYSRPGGRTAGLFSFPTSLHGFSASACATAAQAETDVDDVVLQVMTCAAVNNKETGILAQLAECAAGRAAELSPEQIRNITVSFAKLGYFNTQFKSAMADAVIAKLNDFEPALLADTAWAFGEALYYDFDLMTHLLPYLKSNAQRFDASGMAKMLWTFARFGYQDENLMDLMHEIAMKLQANCNSKSLAEVVYAMAQMGWADMRLHTLVAEYAMDNLQDFDSQSLAKLAYGLAAVGYDDDALYSAITTSAAAVLDSMSPADVAMILWACGEQGHLCGRFMAAVANEYMPNNIMAFTPQQLQTAVVAWNKLGYSNPAVAAAAVRLSEVLPHMAPQFPEVDGQDSVKA